METFLSKVKVEYDDYDIQVERSLLNSFLDSKKFRVPDNFLNCLTAGDIIEIYSFPEHMQIYANAEFLKHSSYSQEQMSTIPFQKLFWRESAVQQQLIERAIEIAKKTKTAERWGLSPHDLVESLHPRKRTFELQMGWIAPVFDYDDKVLGWASTLKVEYIFEWPENT